MKQFEQPEAAPSSPVNNTYNVVQAASSSPVKVIATDDLPARRIDLSGSGNVTMATVLNAPDLSGSPVIVQEAVTAQGFFAPQQQDVTVLIQTRVPAPAAASQISYATPSTVAAGGPSRFAQGTRGVQGVYNLSGSISGTRMTPVNAPSTIATASPSVATYLQPRVVPGSSVPVYSGLRR